MVFQGAIGFHDFYAIIKAKDLQRIFEIACIWGEALWIKVLLIMNMLKNILMH